ncbi:unnamed protein product [Closterium sp. NIES-65]|nr:unnamed protein product [Closterium sp. NIES-65]
MPRRCHADCHAADTPTTTTALLMALWGTLRHPGHPLPSPFCQVPSHALHGAFSCPARFSCRQDEDTLHREQMRCQLLVWPSLFNPCADMRENKGEKQKQEEGAQRHAMPHGPPNQPQSFDQSPTLSPLFLSHLTNPSSLLFVLSHLTNSLLSPLVFEVIFTNPLLSLPLCFESFDQSLSSLPSVFDVISPIPSSLLSVLSHLTIPPLSYLFGVICPNPLLSPICFESFYQSPPLSLFLSHFTYPLLSPLCFDSFDQFPLLSPLSFESFHNPLLLFVLSHLTNPLVSPLCFESFDQSPRLSPLF